MPGPIASSGGRTFRSTSSTTRRLSASSRTRWTSSPKAGGGFIRDGRESVRVGCGSSESEYDLTWLKIADLGGAQVVDLGFRLACGANVRTNLTWLKIADL